MVYGLKFLRLQIAKIYMYHFPLNAYVPYITAVHTESLVEGGIYLNKRVCGKYPVPFKAF